MSTPVRTERMTGWSPQRLARIAGLLYLIASLAGVFGILYGPALVVAGDAAATARNILASEPVFRLSIVSALLDQVIFIGVALVLYQLLKPVNKSMAALMALLMLLSIPIAMFDELNNVAVLVLLGGAGRLSGFTTAQLYALVPLFLNLHARGLDIAFLVGAPWFFPMGYLIAKSGFLPKPLAVLLALNCLAYMLNSFAVLLLPDLKVNPVMFTGWVEVVFALWLLIRGVNVERWEKRALKAA